MRTFAAYLTSSLVHVAALVGLACYLPIELPPKLEVDAGLTIVASYSAATAETETEEAVVLEEVEALA